MGTVGPSELGAEPGTVDANIDSSAPAATNYLAMIHRTIKPKRINVAERVVGDVAYRFQVCGLVMSTAAIPAGSGTSQRP